MNSNAYNDGSNINCSIDDTEFFHNLKFEDLILSWYYIGYKIGLWDWLHFLFQSRHYADSYWNRKWQCNNFFYSLNDYDKHGYNAKQQSLEKKIFKRFINHAIKS